MSDNNVVQLHKPKAGDTYFMLCACNPADPAPYIVQVIIGEPPVVSGLLCPLCETFLPVVNGCICVESKEGDAT